jgi:hypothetical protein
MNCIYKKSKILQNQENACFLISLNPLSENSFATYFCATGRHTVPISFIYYHLLLVITYLFCYIWPLKQNKL